MTLLYERRFSCYSIQGRAGRCKEKLLNCPNKRLIETFKYDLAKDYDITRLKDTFYNYINPIFQNEQKFDLIKDYLQLIRTIKNTLKFICSYLKWGKN